MDIVEFAEAVYGDKLQAWQKKFIVEMQKLGKNPVLVMCKGSGKVRIVCTNKEVKNGTNN